MELENKFSRVASSLFKLQLLEKEFGFWSPTDGTNQTYFMKDPIHVSGAWEFVISTVKFNVIEIQSKQQHDCIKKY